MQMLSVVHVTFDQELIVFLFAYSERKMLSEEGFYFKYCGLF